MSKCAECLLGVNVIAYCVECKKVLCRRCVGRLHFPGLKSAEHTIEEIDIGHAGVQAITVSLLNASVVVGAVVALWHSGLHDDYFKGASTCPSLGWGRETLARFDANVFYYYKSSLSTYCDIEDSFWRLLMDGWTRGVVTGSDSLLLLLSTLPKALLFKSVLSKLLRPIYAVLYAVMATAIAGVLTRFEDAAMAVGGHLPVAASTGMGKKVLAIISKVLRAPSQLKDRLTTKSTVPATAWKLFVALGCSGCLRLAFRTAGFSKLAALDTAGQKVSTWQLAFEPVCFFYMAHLATLLDQKLNKHLYAKKGAPAAAPMTLFRKRPRKDAAELLEYCKERMLRTFNYYRSQAEGVLHMIIDDTFNLVVALRLLSIAFGLSGMFRALLKLCGLGGLLERHGLWLVEATGLAPDSMFLSDRLVQWVEEEVFWGFGKVGSAAVQSEAFSDIWTLDTLLPALWRAALPLFLYLLATLWEKNQKAQQADFKKRWVGKQWVGGAYEECLTRYGSFWMEVPKDQWDPLKSPES